MTLQPLSDAALQTIRDNILRIAALPSDLVTESDDDLISVSLGSRLQLVSLTIKGLDLSDHQRSRLESAIVGTVNNAIRRMAEIKLNNLKRIVGQQTK